MFFVFFTMQYLPEKESFTYLIAGIFSFTYIRCQQTKVLEPNLAVVFLPIKFIYFILFMATPTCLHIACVCLCAATAGHLLTQRV